MSRKNVPTSVRQAPKGGRVRVASFWHSLARAIGEGNVANEKLYR